MPALFGTTIDSVTYEKSTRAVTCAGHAFGINEYSGTSNIEIRKNSDTGSWTSVSSISSWGDETVVGILATDPAVGNWDIRVTSSDGEQDTYENAIIKKAGNNIIMENVGQILWEYGVM